MPIYIVYISVSMPE